MRRRALVTNTILAALVVSGCGGREDDEVGRASSLLRVCASGETTAGIDVSRYQGAVDWDRVARSGVRFAIARVSDGTAHPDATFAENWAAMRRAGLVRGAYQYLEPAEDPAAQAALVVGGVGRLGPGDLPAVLDVETGGSVPREELLAAVRAWVDLVEIGTGKRPMLYTARYFWDSAVRVADYASYPLWVAHYGPSCPDVPEEWSDWRIWQYGTGSAVAGVQTAVDLDVFNGPPEALLRFAGSAGVQAPASVSLTDAGAADVQDAGLADAAAVHVAGSFVDADGAPVAASRPTPAVPQGGASGAPEAGHGASPSPGQRSSSLDAGAGSRGLTGGSREAPRASAGCGCAVAGRRPGSLVAILAGVAAGAVRRTGRRRGSRALARRNEATLPLPARRPSPR